MNKLVCLIGIELALLYVEAYYCTYIRFRSERTKVDENYIRA